MDDIVMSYLDEEEVSVFPSIDPLQRAAQISQTLKSLPTTSLSQSSARLLVLSLRQVNRLLHERVVEQRRSLTGLRSGIDEINAKLTSCRFEKQYLLAQAQKCLNVKTFYNSVPIEEPLTGDEDHLEVLTRLQRELAQRKELQARLLAILHRKQETEELLAEKLKKFDEFKQQLHQLIKASKTIAEMSQFQPEKEEVSSKSTSNTQSSPQTEKFDLNAVYDQLASFVADRPNYQLRFVEEEAREEGIVEGSIELNSLQAPFIHLRLLELEADLFISSQQQFLVKHATLSSVQLSESFIRGLPGEFDWLEDGNSSSGSIEAFLQALETGIKQRIQLHAMIDDLMIPAGTNITFSPSEANILTFDSTSSSLSAQLIAKVDWRAASVIWMAPDGNAELPFLEDVNAIALKYRSVVDCLHSQLELLFETNK